MDSHDEMSKVRAVKVKYERRLLKKKNVVGVGIGYREMGGKLTDQIALTVMVENKQPLSSLRKRDVIPSELDGVQVDVKEVGKLSAVGV
ncbi:MAG: hypothetical protein JXA89_07725 [Anaerolineae bacterium]|nr:hypothetical protein [Anaerolineae bacterium]